MKRKATVAVRVLMGLVFVASGVAYFFSQPPTLQGPMADFFNGMMATKYFFYLLKFSEIACGLMLISGRFVPLALVVLAPIVLNIFLVHVFLSPEGTPLAVMLGVMESYLAFFADEYAPTIKTLFRAR